MNSVEKKSTRLDDFRNMLIWGDNKLAMGSLLSQLRAAKTLIDVVYIDPPFDVGADFSMKVDLGEDESIFKDQSVLEMVAYKDMWGRQMNSYLSVMYERLVLIRQLLAPTGSIYLHCDWHISGYLRCLMDDVFGEDNLLNEVVWSYALGGSASDRYLQGAGSKHPDHYKKLAQNMRKTLLFGSGLMPVGLLRDCLDYALNDSARYPGVFESVREAFRFQGSRKVLEEVNAIYDFRNKHVAHQEVELTDAKSAMVALARWIKGLRLLATTGTLVANK
ncbi:site-specific DNA-methyltransferase [Leptolyngbya sp. 15MV]|nr:site-specific DNA-methyltransferase [Leptolyngbya sp. 15MV]